jgi:hypothetical protein
MMRERRKDHQMRQMIDEYRRLAGDARQNAGSARSDRIRAELTAMAKSWDALAEELAGRTSVK